MCSPCSKELVLIDGVWNYHDFLGQLKNPLQTNNQKQRKKFALRFTFTYKMFSLFLYLSSILFCVTISNNLKNHPTKILDVMHEKIPELKAQYLGDILVFVQVAFCTTIITWKELNLFFLIMGFTQFLKGICSFVTVLPPLKSYQDKIRIGGLNGCGTEYIFSGHASYCALTFIFLVEKFSGVFFPLLAYNIITQVIIVISRNHYTIDVILAWIIVVLFYNNLGLCLQLEWCYNRFQVLYEPILS